MEQQDIRELKVAEIAHEEWPTLAPEETVESTIKLFAETGISGAPVVDDGRLVGIVTEGDLIFQDADVKAPGFLDILGGIIPLGSWDEYRTEALKSAGVTVDEVMTSDPITISPDASLAEASTI
ncbi:MAG: CBS domain-containing protein, partial [Actinomycetota bacterium]|nr:CBS domain-containing protein [Actinomycetota bacterium]